jgi:helix-turn-helix, Psq domain
MPCENMDQMYTNSPKWERIELAIRAVTQENGLSATKAAKIYKIAPSKFTRRLLQIKTSRKAVSQSQQLLTPVEEQIIVKRALQYYTLRHLPHLRQKFSYENSLYSAT